MSPDMGKCFLCGVVHDYAETPCDYEGLKAVAINSASKAFHAEARERLVKRLVGALFANSGGSLDIEGEKRVLARLSDLNAVWDACSSIDVTAMECRGEEFARRCRLFNRLLCAAFRVFKAPAGKQSLRERMDDLKQAVLPLLTAGEAAKTVLEYDDFFTEEE